jgi:hypothetical protein
VPFSKQSGAVPNRKQEDLHAGGVLGPVDESGEVVDKGDLGALEEGQGDRVDDGGLASGRDADVVRFSGLDQFEPVLEAGATAAVDGDAQHHRMALGLAQFGQPFRGAVGQGQAVTAGGRRDLEGGLRR